MPLWVWQISRSDLEKVAANHSDFVMHLFLRAVYVTPTPRQQWALLTVMHEVTIILSTET